MKEYSAEVVINGSPEEVWEVLVAGESWPEWDPYCDRIDGDIGEGQKLKAYSKLSPGRAFPVKVVEFNPHETMVWQGGMPLGLFKGVRTFELTEDEAGTRFRLHERFSGPMLKLIGGSIPDMSEAFQAFVEGLKKRVEDPPKTGPDAQK